MAKYMQIFQHLLIFIPRFEFDESMCEIKNMKPLISSIDTEYRYSSLSGSQLETLQT